MRDPGHRALHKAARACVVSTTAFVIGRYVVDDDQFAVVAAFSAFALSAFADFGGPPRARLAAYLGALVTGIPLIALGTALSETTWPAALCMLAVGFLASFAGIYGGYLAAGVNTIILLYVLAAGVPAPSSAIGDRLAGLAAGTALAAAGAVVLWPHRPRRDFLRPLAEAMRALAAWLDAAAAGRRDAEAERAAGAAVAALRPELARMVERPAGPTTTDRAQAFLVYNLDRLRDLTARLARLQERAPHPLMPGAAALLDRASAALDDAAAVVGGEEREPRAAELMAAVRADIAATPATLERVAGAETDPHRVISAYERAFTVQELAGTAGVAAAHARAAAGRGAAPDMAGGPATLLGSVAGPPSLLLEAWRKAAANLTVRSYHFRSSLRLGVGLAAALGVVKAFDLQHGFWVALAALMVMRSCARETSANALKATLGTALGVALSLALVVVADADHWIYALVLPVGFFAAVFAAETSGLVAAQAAFAVTVIALFNLMKPSDWELGLVRLEDVLIGAVVGIAIGVAIWPRGAAGQLRAALGALLEQGAAYAAVAARGQLARSEPADAAESRERAVFSGRRAEDAFRAYLTERRPSGSQLRGWSNALVAGDRLWYTADRAAVRATDAPPPRPCGPLTAELEGTASRMEAGYRALARALVEGRDPPAPVPVAPSGLDEAATACARGALAGDGAAAAELLWVRYWLGDLFDGLRSASAGLAHADVP